jgi:hypothetical protein
MNRVKLRIPHKTKEKSPTKIHYKFNKKKKVLER